MPDARPRAVGLPLRTHSMRIQTSPAVAAAAWVAAKALPAWPLEARPLPPLNPNQPNQSKPAPRSVSTMLPGWMAEAG